MMATFKNELPQGGTGQAGESPGASASMSRVSGGGKKRLMSLSSCDESRRDGGSNIEDDSEEHSAGSVSGKVVWKKRTHKETGGDKEKMMGGSDASSDEASKPKIGTSARGRGRPPTTGKYVGLAKDKEDYRKKKEERELSAEEEITEKLVQVRKASSQLKASVRLAISEDQSVVDLSKLVEDNVDVIFNVATKSSNLKGTFQKALKEAATSIKEVLGVLQQRTMSEETKKLQEDNARLQTDLADIRRELAELKANLIRAPPREDLEELPLVAITDTQAKKRQEVSLPSGDGDTQELVRSIMIQVGGMINARFAGMEDRLLPEKRLRPPLAADKAREAPSTSRPIIHASESKTGEKLKKKQGTTQVAPLPKKSLEMPLATPQSMNEKWSLVARKKGKKKAGTVQSSTLPSPATQPVKQVTKQSAKKASKLRAPRSAAVVVTLQPGAETRGMTYSKVLTEAKGKINLASLGIAALRFRQAATGARILEVPGVTGNEKADSLAQKLKEAFSPDDIRVHRPVKCADVRISGLDDSVTTDEIISAVARDGECSVDSIRSGEIQSEYSGLGAVIVKCPVDVARKLSKNGRLLIGWVSAQVRLMQARPMRCYKCMEIGHVRVCCPSEVDRSSECYRCGKTGHKSRQCSEEAHCNLCAVANKPAGHKLGSSKCAAPKPKSRGRAIRAMKSQQQANSTPNVEIRAETVSMDTI